MDEFEKYISIGDKNFGVFKDNLNGKLVIFKVIDDELERIRKHLNLRVDDLGNKKYSQILRILLVYIHRQFRSCFVLLMRRQSFDALAVVRIAIECTVHAFRIFEKPELATVFVNWVGDSKGWEEFNKNFRKSLPDNMPRKDELHKAWNMMNKLSAHPDFLYFVQSLKISEKEIKVHYYDSNEEWYLGKIAWTLSQYFYCVEVVRKIFEEYLPMSMSWSGSTWNSFQRVLGQYTNSYSKWLKSIEVNE